MLNIGLCSLLNMCASMGNWEKHPGEEPKRLHRSRGQWTAEDLDALRADVPYRTEIVDGNLIVNPRPNPWHNDVIRVMTNALVAALPPALWAFFETEIRWIDEEGIRHSLVPDVMVAPKRLRDERTPFAAAADVALVVEVESRSTRKIDRTFKPRLYADLGISDMWRVESDLTLVKYRLTPEGGPEIVQKVTGGTFVTEDPFPVSIDLDALR